MFYSLNTFLVISVSIIFIISSVYTFRHAITKQIILRTGINPIDIAHDHTILSRRDDITIFSTKEYLMVLSKKDLNDNEVGLVFHGNAMNSYSTAHVFSQFPGKNIKNLAFIGYPGRSGVDLEFNEVNVMATTLKCIEILKNKGFIISFVAGISLGGGLAISIATHLNIDTIIVYGTFSSFTNIALEKSPFKCLSSVLMKVCKENFDFNSVEKLSTYKGRLVIIHSLNDIVVPIHHARQLRASAQKAEIYDYLETHSVGHCALSDIELMVDVINKL